MHIKPKKHEPLSQASVYRYWMERSTDEWQLDPDSRTSAFKLLEEQEGIDVLSIGLEANGVEAYAFLDREMVKELGPTLVEAAMDATYKTNKENLELFTVMAEVDGMGFPLGYMLLSATEKLVPHVKTEGIRRFCKGLKERRINPRIMHVDKDLTEINAIKQTWPDAKISLCLWHVKDAVKKRLCRNDPTREYDSIRAHACHSFIDPTFCPDPSNVSEYSSAPSGADTIAKMVTVKRKLNTTFCPTEEREKVLEMMFTHYCQHHTFPVQDKDEIISAQEIHLRAVWQMYEFCHERDLRECWAYLWNEWYCPEKWVLWARSAFDEIPFLRTTTIVEAHWKVIKHQFLHDFKAPRLDLIVHILCSAIFP
ncbi:hypothetical protein BT69DRAFT_1220360, partial [Atractiella rhizophila]